MSHCLIAAILLAAITVSGSAQPYRQSDFERPMARREMVIGRSYDKETSGRINQKTRVAKPRIISKTEWGGGESSGTMRDQFPYVLTFHHVASPSIITATDDAATSLQNLQKYGWNQKNWPDLPYHFLLGYHGEIYEGRDPLKVGDTNTRYDPSGKLLISMMGNYELQTPNEKQLTAVCDLMAWASDYYNIPPETIRGHMEFTKTGCPGRYLYPYVASGYFEGEVRQRLARAYGVTADDRGTTSGRTIGAKVRIRQ
jgi:hypothetical protein